MKLRESAPQGHEKTGTACVSVDLTYGFKTYGFKGDRPGTDGLVIEITTESALNC